MYVCYSSPLGCSVTEGIECIPGSATYFISTGVSLSTYITHKNKKLINKNKNIKI